MTRTVVDHLLDRLIELDIDQLFGVPGDFTLGMLDHVVAHPGLGWAGCTNELNAGYAADGYARIRGAGALMTTFGVGELSAVNAVAGSFAEHVPVVHIVGAPATTTQAAGRAVHHTLGDGDFEHFAPLWDGITCASAMLTADNAVEEIDRVLAAVRDQHRPGYLLLPLDIAELPVPAVEGGLPRSAEPTDQAAIDAFAQAAASLLDPARDVTVLAGVLVHRFAATDALTALLENPSIRSATTLWGKSVIDETRPAHLGIYSGAASTTEIRDAVEGADALVVAGVEVTDLNSGFFTQHFDADRTIELRPDHARIGDRVFDDVPLDAALEVLHRLSTPGDAASTETPEPATSLLTPDDCAAAGHDEPLDQDALWRTVAQSVAPGDIVLADQGTSFYGVAPYQLPQDVTFIGQPLWASIGYTLPAALGAGLAAPGRRVLLLVGDGAAQMTVGELSTIIARGHDTTVLVVDNDGYTVERAIHGPTASYNDIAHWDWTHIASGFARDPRTPDPRTVTATTTAQLRDGLSRTAGITVVQAVVDRLDVPPLLVTLAHAASTANAS